MGQKHQFFTNAVGRFVSGSLTEKRTKDVNGRPIPEDKQKFEFGIAFQKTDPDMQRLFGEFYTFISAQWAADQNKIQALNNWFQTFQGVPMKISDGDAPNARQQTNENTAGCFVFWFSSTYPIKCCDPANQEIAAESVKRGYYVQMAGNIADNGLPWQADGKGAGIYMNPSVVRLVAEGEQIVGGIDAATAFGGTVAPAQGQLPPGAVPLGTAVTQTPAAPGAPMAQPTIPGQPAAAPTQPAAPQAPQAQPGLPAGGPGTLPNLAAPQTAPAPTGAPAGVPGTTPAPHTAILNAPQTPAAPTGAPGLPGLPGQQ